MRASEPLSLCCTMIHCTCYIVFSIDGTILRFLMNNLSYYQCQTHNKSYPKMSPHIITLMLCEARVAGGSDPCMPFIMNFFHLLNLYDLPWSFAFCPVFYSSLIGPVSQLPSSLCWQRTIRALLGKESVPISFCTYSSPFVHWPSYPYLSLVKSTFKI